jgi:hypothetical protein
VCRNESSAAHRFHLASAAGRRRAVFQQGITEGLLRRGHDRRSEPSSACQQHHAGTAKKDVVEVLEQFRAAVNISAIHAEKARSPNSLSTQKRRFGY